MSRKKIKKKKVKISFSNEERTIIEYMKSGKDVDTLVKELGITEDEAVERLETLIQKLKSSNDIIKKFLK